MYNVKSSCTSSKKHQGKNLHNIKHSIGGKIEDKNDNLDKMVVKSLKPKMSSESIVTPDKSKDSKFAEHSNFLTNQTQSADKHSDKRKDEKLSLSTQKKLKSDNSAEVSEQSSESLPPKKPNKFKSLFPKTYICKYCCRRFQSVEQLRQHTNAEHANKPSHVCHLCSHQAASFSALMTHYLKHSGNKRDNVDKIYAKSKADFSNIQFNMFSRPKSAIECSKCNLTFNSKAKYDAHNCSNIPQKSEYNCAYCRHVSITVEDYRNHIQSHSETPFTCSYCKHKAMTKKQFDSHKESCKVRLKSNVNYKCDKCNDYSTKSKKEYNYHLKNCGTNISQTCTKCGVEFKDEKSYEEHVLVCNKNDNQTSNKSNIINKNKSGIQKTTKKIMKRKRKTKESISDKNKLLCCVCDYVCYSKSDHEEHERQCLADMVNNSNNSSAKISSSVCPVCGDTIDDSKLIEHSKICHSKNNVGLEKQLLNDDLNTRRSRRLVRRKSSFTDDEIQKSKPLKIKIPRKPRIPKLLMKPKFRKGRQSKNANNPFLCNYCDFTFCSKSTLLRHKRMHSGNPWYVCQYCGKFFFRKDVYIRHEMNVHKNSSKNMFCCYYCKLCFSETLTLREHVEAAHKKSAFLPIKKDASIKDDDDTLVKKSIIIKKEKNIDVDDTAKAGVSGEIKVEPSEKNNCLVQNYSPNCPKFKCSECFEYFESVSHMEIHMQTHAKCSSTSKSLEGFESVSKHDRHVATNERSLLSKSTSKINKFSRKEKKLSDASKLSTVSLEKSFSGTFDHSGEIDEISYSEFPAIDKLDSTITTSSSEYSGTLQCKLCLKCFTTLKDFTEHRDNTHKIIDWFQCLVCSTCGPKGEMLEHMLTHMCKVGSFVVAGREDYDAIIASSLQSDRQKKIIEKKSDTTQQVTDTAKNITLVSDDELPPLKEYGFCLCYDKKFEQKTEVCTNSSSVECNAANIEQSKSEETLKCFETALDSSEKCQERRKLSLTESINLSVENTSTNLSAQNVSNPCNDSFQEEVSKNEEVVEDNKILQIEDATETISPVKPDFTSDLKSVENSLDEAENFSQLRYLLQNPNSKHSTENKVSLYSFSQLPKSSSIFDKQNSPVKTTTQDLCCIDTTNLISKNDSNFASLDLSSKNNSNFTTLNLSSKNNSNFTSLDLSCKNNTNFTSLDLSSKNNIDFITSNLLPKSDINSISSKQNFNNSENRDKTSTAQENNQSSNTCLKFDINQSRCEFLENISYTKILNTSNQRTQNNTELEKNENFFKTGPTPNAILDFSDLIQHSFENSSPSDDNIFSYSLPKQPNSSLNISMREEVRTPDCSDMMNYDSSEYNSTLKCQKCNVLLLDHNDKLNHKCSSLQPEQSIDVDLFSHYKPKNTFYSLANFENQNKSTSIDSAFVKKEKLTPEKPSNIFVCSMCTKVLSTEVELVKHQKTDHAQNSTQTCECTKCHRMFTDIGELMKHSLTCLRTLFLKTTTVNDCLSPSASLQSFMKKEEPKTNFSVNTPLSFSAIPNDFSRQNSENLQKRSFNS